MTDERDGGEAQMKKVMTGALIVAVLGIGGTTSAMAASPSQDGQQPRQDCRTYSSVTQCGEPQLNQTQQACVNSAVQQGMTERRAVVECHTFA
ncbi:hypothetical protein [Actinomadura decatromicini]|uniref:DUF3551 domain-containing protein n=1 Tax=Actinomadura decatromicini TaxID=2604572 RepID=A0A5D3FGN3_9ACTN|nr:hypothetical protein [Actinomadura decatromicini]TYK47239.1 hypothetical protein FXF68_25965 [Actinomadura decatromicini]